MNSVTTIESGEKLLHAVERILADDDHLMAVTHRLRGAAKGDREDACRRAIAEYSNKSAYAGAVAAFPGTVPGCGTAVMVGLTFVEMAYVMKTEVELCLVLSALCGFDIKNREHRQVAYLLAALGTHEVDADRNPALDYGTVGALAVWNYGPRELSKRVLEVFGMIATVRAAQKCGAGLLRAIPFIGLGVGAGLNKALTAKIGRRAHGALVARSEYLARSRA